MTRLVWAIIFVAIVTTSLSALTIHLNGVLVGQKITCERNLDMTKAEYKALYDKFYEYKKSKWSK